LTRDIARAEREAGILVDYAREEDEVAEEEDNWEGVEGGWRTRCGRFGYQVGPYFDFPQSQGISRIVGK
jgi:hypothetical protein